MNRIGLTTCVALGTAGIAVAAGTAARAGASVQNLTNAKNLVVTLVTPTNNQEVLPDLSDPGLNGVITVRFSSPINVRDIIDDQNVVNRLTDQMEFFDSTFLRLPGNPVVQRNVFIFQPLSSKRF